MRNPSSALKGYAGRHLSDRQLVDLVIGASSRAGTLAAGRHLAACSFCRQDLESLRSVDRQLEAGARRMAMIPRSGSAAVRESRRPGTARPGLPPAVTRAPMPWRQRVVVPLAAAFCCLFAARATVERAGPPPAARARGIEVAGSPAAPPRAIVCAFEIETRSFQRNAPATAVAETGFLTDAATKRIPGFAVPETAKPAPAAWTPPVPAAAPPRARPPRERPRGDSAASRVRSRQHPGAGRHGDSISPPSRGA